VCECSFPSTHALGTSEPGRRSALPRLLTTVLVAALGLPSAVCTRDEGLLASTGTKLRVCEDRVEHLTAEVGRLQAQLLALQRADGEPTRGGQDGAIGGGGGARAGTANEAPSGVLVPSAMPVGRVDLDDPHRRRQEVAGRASFHLHKCRCRFT
jgi:hypothetical protein